ncbi:hypothetical protein [Litoreibacter janthinus]|uniref:Uncharacterized protein n=1 Tax=Litoreibacter janthinus TaxID=670154 RepID=A0A1I6HWD4_9RHOB|nr:hypothetical protein [Litoreibacter janthinus]SFR58755.1 hypothetical protein SAMN04488002_3518 [Litoreibacter janthinus]
MSLQQIDTMVDFAIAEVSTTPDGHRSVVRDLARKWPDVTGAQIVFVLVSAAHAIEQVFGAEPEPRAEVQQTFRVAALLSSDLFALQMRGNFAPTGRDLSIYWREEDPFFLKL